MTELTDPLLGTQFLAALSACMGSLSIGSVIGYTSPVGPMFANGTGNNLYLTEAQLSLFSSTVFLGALVGGLVGGYLMNTYGRRGTMLISVPIIVVGWGITIGAQGFTMLLIGRIISGISVGINSLSVPTYIGEISSKNIRGTLGSGFQLMLATGILYAYSLGPAFDSFRYLAIACLIIPIVFGVAMFFQPETPTFLIYKGKDDECKKALQYLRGPHYDITAEYEVLKVIFEENQKNKLKLRDLKAPYILKPLTIALLLFTFQQLCGIVAITLNMNSIFIASGVAMSASLSAIIVALLKVITTVGAVALLDKVGRKILLILSAAFMMLSLASLGVFFYILENAEEEQNVIDNFGWLPLTSISIFISAYSIGFGPIPWVMMSELFSSDVREAASALVMTINYILAFLVAMVFQSLQNAIHDYGTYWLFSVFCLFNLIFCVVMVPETKGKSLEEITEMFGKVYSKLAVDNKRL